MRFAKIIKKQRGGKENDKSNKNLKNRGLKNNITSKEIIDDITKKYFSDSK